MLTLSLVEAAPGLGSMSLGLRNVSLIPDPGGIEEISRWREPPEPGEYHESAPEGRRIPVPLSGHGFLPYQNPVARATG
jgi:hypothetical protein